LFNKANYISAITIAGAAQEILGKIAMKKEGINAMFADKVFFDQLADYFEKPRPELKKIIKQRNRVKNELKHNDIGEDYEIQHDFEYEAEELIISAVNNYVYIFKEYPKHRVIRNFTTRWT
jgi:hypothetical protein